MEDRHPLLERDYALLRALSEHGGFLTRDVCQRAGLPAGRASTMAARAALLHMQNLGLVTELDPQKPIVWMRTMAGTKALAVADPVDVP